MRIDQLRYFYTIFLVLSPPMQAFVVNPRRSVLSPSTHWQHINPGVSSVNKLSATTQDDDRELVRVPRRGGRGDRERSGDNAEDFNRRDEGYDDDYDDEHNNTLEEDDDDDWDYEDDEDWENDEEGESEYELFGNVLIPNPLLDSMDPDGAAERFPELARDPRFWFDMILFLAFLDFLSFVGPRDPFPDLPMY